jgi:hypothetical protein
VHTLPHRGPVLALEQAVFVEGVGERLLREAGGVRSRGGIARGAGAQQIEAALRGERRAAAGSGWIHAGGHLGPAP